MSLATLTKTSLVISTFPIEAMKGRCRSLSVSGALWPSWGGIKVQKVETPRPLGPQISFSNTLSSTYTGTTPPCYQLESGFMSDIDDEGSISAASSDEVCPYAWLLKEASTVGDHMSESFLPPVGFPPTGLVNSEPSVIIQAPISNGGSKVEKTQKRVASWRSTRPAWTQSVPGPPSGANISISKVAEKRLSPNC